MHTTAWGPNWGCARKPVEEECPRARGTLSAAEGHAWRRGTLWGTHFGLGGQSGDVFMPFCMGKKFCPSFKRPKKYVYHPIRSDMAFKILTLWPRPHLVVDFDKPCLQNCTPDGCADRCLVSERCGSTLPSWFRFLPRTIVVATAAQTSGDGPQQISAITLLAFSRSPCVRAT